MNLFKPELKNWRRSTMDNKKSKLLYRGVEIVYPIKIGFIWVKVKDECGNVIYVLKQYLTPFENDDNNNPVTTVA